MELRYEPMERLRLSRPKSRVAYVVDACQGRKVLDLGAMDETAFEAKRGSGFWLHEEIARVAARVLGIDASPAVPVDGISVAANARIVRGDIFDIGNVLRAHGFDPDVVVAGEVIEHLSSPVEFLTALAREPLLRGKTLILTTPNATAIHNVFVGLLGRESTHHDHLCILSFKTLNTLFRRTGFQSWDIVPYLSAFTEMRARNKGVRGMLVAAGERVVNGVEFLFPLLSFGYIVRATI